MPNLIIRTKLSSEEEQALKNLRHSRTGSTHAERAYYVLLSFKGLSPDEIAKQLNRNPHTIRCWLKRYRATGISGHEDIKGSGRPRGLRENAKQLLGELLDSSPKKYGYPQSGWQINLLISQLSI